MNAIADITRQSVLEAIEECDRCGRGFFRVWYGYRRSNAYVLVHNGREYDTKPIAAVAFGREFGCPPLRPQEFSGGAEHVGSLLVRLGFTVRCGEETLTQRAIRATRVMFRRLRKTIVTMTARTRAWLVGLVSCSKSKLDHAAPAKDLYTPSYVFRLSRQYVEARCDEWWILSAKHGLVHPDAELEPYDEALTGAPKRIRERWTAKVREALRELYEGRWIRFIVLAGDAYAGAVRGLGLEVEEPLKGLGTGKRRQWLAEHTREQLPMFSQV